MRVDEYSSALFCDEYIELDAWPIIWHTAANRYTVELYGKTFTVQLYDKTFTLLMETDDP